MYRLKACLLVITIAIPTAALASIPRASSVPGGIAVVPLGPAQAEAKPPQAWLGTQPVLVTSENDQWYAVVGLALGKAPGLYSLRVESAGESKTHDFKIEPKNYPEQRISIKDNGKVQLSVADDARARREIAAIKALKRHWRATSDTDPGFILPAAGRLGGRFGLRRYFNDQARSPHSGLDVVVPGGTPVMASSHGEVLAVDDYFFNGKTVFLDHGNGLITLYCHLDRIDVRPGEPVSKGQTLGLSGQTGRATGPHLHWSVVLNGEMVDPELFIAEGRSTIPD